jgi:hypothetical protein
VIFLSFNKSGTRIKLSNAYCINKGLAGDKKAKRIAKEEVEKNIFS